MTEPETKRRKTEIPDEVIEKVNTCLIEKLISDMKESTNNLIPILSSDVLRHPPLKSMLAASVLGKKLIHQVILKLNALLPIPECQYLKRVRDSDILLCSEEQMSMEETRNFFIQNGFNYQEFFEHEMKTVFVASAAPITRVQFERAIEYWPCNFHPNKKVELQLSGNYFDAINVKRHRKYMKLAYEIAEMYEDKHDREVALINAANVDSHISEIIDKDCRNKEQRFNLIEDKETIKKKLRELKGVVVVDPSIDSIVAVGYDRRRYNPCQHPVMIAVDNVARSQYGGAWYDDSMTAEELPDEKVENRVLDGVPKMFRNILNATYDDLKFGANPTKKRETASDYDELQTMETYKTDDVNENEDLTSCFGRHKKRGSLCSNLGDDDKPSGPYLCTGYDVYTTNEPCIMCSMALVHSRVKRVFYAIENEEKGALGSMCQLHTVPNLNHHFEVFTGFFQDL